MFTVVRRNTVYCVLISRGLILHFLSAFDNTENVKKCCAISLNNGIENFTFFYNLKWCWGGGGGWGLRNSIVWSSIENEVFPKRQSPIGTYAQQFLLKRQLHENYRSLRWNWTLDIWYIIILKKWQRHFFLSFYNQLLKRMHFRNSNASGITNKILTMPSNLQPSL